MRAAVGSTLWRTLGRFMEEDALRPGAALAFYATLSLTPLLLLVVSAVALFAQDDVTADRFLDQLAPMLGDGGAEVAARIIEHAPGPNTSVLAMIGGVALLLVGGSVLFVNVQGTLNAIWRVKRRAEGVVRGLVRSRLLAFLMMLASGGALFLSVLLGAAANWVAPVVENRLPIGAAIVQLMELGVSGIVLTLLCAATYRILPDVRIAWRDVWLGAGLTAGLFLVGRHLIGWYLSTAAVDSQFGAAGSAVVFMMWLYYSAQIFVFGAEFTQIWAEERGEPIVPTAGAVRVERKEVGGERE